MERSFVAAPVCVVWESAVQFPGRQQLNPLAHTSQMIHQSIQESRDSKQESAAGALPSRDSLASASSQQEGPGPAGTPGKVLSYASLSEAKICEDSRPKSIAQPAVSASQAPHPTPSLSPMYTLQT